MNSLKNSSRGRRVSNRSCSGGSGRGINAERGRSLTPKGGGSASSIVCHCVTCKFPVLNNDEGGIECDECEQWCHGSQVCTGLPEDFVKQVLRHQGKGVKYVCTKCRLHTPSGTAKGGKLDQADLASMRECMTQMFNTIAGLSNMVRTIDARISGNSLNVNANGNELTTDDTTVRTMIREEVREMHERDKRKNSIIVRGLQYGDDFQNKFDGIVSFLIPDSTNRITLTDVVPISPSLVRAKISNMNARLHLLSKTNKLRNSQFSNIFISRDLTYTQRQELRNKRATRMSIKTSDVTKDNTPQSRSLATGNPDPPLGQ